MYSCAASSQSLNHVLHACILHWNNSCASIQVALLVAITKCSMTELLDSKSMQPVVQASVTVQYRPSPVGLLTLMSRYTRGPGCKLDFNQAAVLA